MHFHLFLLCFFLMHPSNESTEINMLPSSWRSVSVSCEIYTVQNYAHNRIKAASLAQAGLIEGHSCSLPNEGIEWSKLFNILDIYRTSLKESPTREMENAFNLFIEKTKWFGCHVNVKFSSSKYLHILLEQSKAVHDEWILIALYIQGMYWISKATWGSFGVDGQKPLLMSLIASGSCPEH